jgi:hypothetical protein
MAKKRPTPRQRQAAQARHEHELRHDTVGRRSWVRIVAALAVLGMILSGFGATLFLLFD